MEKLNAANQIDVRKAASLLLQGGIGAIPTETVYGLAADATQLRAVARIFEAKERPVFDPLIVHVAGFREAWEVAADISPEAEKLMRAFWPGPLTVILPKKEIIPDLVTAGLQTVAVRSPRHDGTLALLKALGRPIAAPSANRYGRTSPTTAEDAVKELGERMDFVLDGGACAVGVESTIVRVVDGGIEILRPGWVTLEKLREVVPNVRMASVAESGEMFPGSGERHYATETPLLYPADSVEEVVSALQNLRSMLKDQKKTSGKIAWPRIGFLAFGPAMDTAVFAEQRSLSEKKDAAEAAARLFSSMRSLDEARLDWIIAEKFGPEGIAHAVDDRLSRASVAVSLDPLYQSLGAAPDAAASARAKRRADLKPEQNKNLSNLNASEDWAPSDKQTTRRPASRRISSRGAPVKTHKDQSSSASRSSSSDSDRSKRGRVTRAPKKRGAGKPAGPALEELTESLPPLNADKPTRYPSKAVEEDLPAEDSRETQGNRSEREFSRPSTGEEGSEGEEGLMDDEDDDEEGDEEDGGEESENGPENPPNQAAGGEVDEDSQQRFFGKQGSGQPHLNEQERFRPKGPGAPGGRPDRGGRPSGRRDFGRPSFGNRGDRGNRPPWQGGNSGRFGRGGDSQRGPQGNPEHSSGRPFRPQEGFQGDRGDRQGGSQYPRPFNREQERQGGGRPYRPQGGAPYRGRRDFGGRQGGGEGRPFSQGSQGNFRPRRGFDNRGPQSDRPGRGGGSGFRPRPGGWRDNPQGGGDSNRGGFGPRPSRWQGQGGQGQGHRGGPGGPGGQGGFRPRQSPWQGPDRGGRDRFRGNSSGRPFRRPGGPGGFRGDRPGGFRRRPEEGSGGGSSSSE